jgi:hypothetical protein
MAERAKQHGGDAILPSSDVQNILGSATYGTGSAVVNGNTVTASGTSVSLPWLRWNNDFAAFDRDLGIDMGQPWLGGHQVPSSFQDRPPREIHTMLRVEMHGSTATLVEK